MPDIASLILVCASAAVYVALMVSLRVRKASTFALQPLLGEGELLLLALELGLLGLQVGDLLGQAGLAGERLAGEVLAADRDRLLGLALELVGLAPAAG